MSDYADFLNQYADKLSEGWHDGYTIDASDIVDIGKAADRIVELEAEAMDMSNAYTVLEQKNHDLKTKNALWKESFDRINSAHDSAVQRIVELEARLVMAEGYMSKAALRRFRKASGGNDVSATD